jgi:hypothetical protein
MFETRAADQQTMLYSAVNRARRTWMIEILGLLAVDFHGTHFARSPIEHAAVVHGVGAIAILEL